MKLKTLLHGKTYEFRNLADVLAKANEPKSADRLQNIAARSASERVAAKIALAAMTVGDLTENPVLPYEDDEVTRANIDSLNQPLYKAMKNKTIGELREWILDHKTTGREIERFARAFTGEVAAAAAKIMSTMDLVYAARKISRVTRCNTEIGQPGTLSFRCQANSATDDVDDIVTGVMEGVSYGCGDACIGINPVNDSVESTRRIAEGIFGFISKHEIPTQITVLSHITTQMKALEEGAPLSMVFQSIAGTEAANSNFGVDKKLIEAAYALARRKAFAAGPNLLYFETGQGSEVSIGADRGADELTLEGRTYGFARCFEPFLVNNVSGFIGPETLYDGKEMIRANLEDHFMGKLLGLPMGLDPCYTNHTQITQDDQEMATMLTALAGANYYMGVPMGDDVMLNYQNTSFHDNAALRELTGRKPAREFHLWMMKRGLMDENGVLTEAAGDGSIFL
ncbi:MAG: ethanolamine ammonia-lyase subunit EutB [Acidaminococcales bacterium]|jgi:ethanolamine ammonia-lyase large subunit|nr:ethanolamine ammonia-lyase subunit EutB [Acidaminococcales bacterium]